MTRDYVNPEAPWPQIAALAATCRARRLHARASASPIYPEYVVGRAFSIPSLHRRRSIACATPHRAGGHPCRSPDALRTSHERRPARASPAPAPRPTSARSIERVLDGGTLTIDEAVASPREPTATTCSRSSRPPTPSAKPTSATTSPTSSTATSTSPTSASSAAGSARSSASAGSRTPTTSGRDDPRQGRRKRSTAAPPRSACRAASTPRCRRSRTGTS